MNGLSPFGFDGDERPAARPAPMRAAPEASPPVTTRRTRRNRRRSGAGLATITIAIVVLTVLGVIIAVLGSSDAAPAVAEGPGPIAKPAAGMTAERHQVDSGVRPVEPAAVAPPSVASPDQEHRAGPAGETVAAQIPQAPEQPATPLAQVAEDPRLALYGRFVAGLTGQMVGTAEAPAQAKPPASLATLARTWQQRFAVLERALGQRQLRLHMPAIVPGKRAYLTAVEGERIFIDMEGASSVLPSALFPLPEQARIFAQIAAAPGSEPRDTEVAFVAHLLAGEVDLATLLARRHGDSWSAELHAHEPELQEMARLHAVRRMLDAGRSAAANGDRATVERCIRQLSTGCLEDVPAAQAAVAQLHEPMLAASASAGRAGGTPVSAASAVPSGFATVSGTWQVGKQGLENSGDAVAECAYAGELQSARIVIFPRVATGQVKIQLAGVTIDLDLATSTWRIAARGGRGEALPVTLLPRAHNSITVTRQSGGTLSIGLNDAAQNVVAGRDVGRTLGISCSGGAIIALGEPTFTYPSEAGTR